MAEADKARGTRTRRERLRGIASRYHWVVFAALALATITMGYLGFRAELAADASRWDAFYFAIQLFILESGNETHPVTHQGLEIARWLAPVLAGYATIWALLTLFQEQWQLLGVRTLRNHVVICGVGREGRRLAERFRAEGVRVVAVEHDADNPHVANLRRRVPVLIGDARDPEVLRRAKVPVARRLICVCGDDGVNAEIAMNARKLALGRTSAALDCHAEIIDPDLCQLLREREFAGVRRRGFRLEFFNLAEIGARALLDAHSWATESPADAESRHVFIAGRGELTRQLVLLLARRWGGTGTSGGERLEITLADPESEIWLELLRQRWPGIDHVTRIRLLPADFGADALTTLSPSSVEAADTPIGLAYVCLEDDTRSLRAALALHTGARRSGLRFPVVVVMRETAGLAALLQGQAESEGGFADLEAFSLLDATCQPSVLTEGLTETVARAIHENYRQAERQRGSTPQSNPSMVSWQELTEDLRESNRSQADSAVSTLEDFRYSIAPRSNWSEKTSELRDADLEPMARREHDRWCMHQREAGWTYAAGPKDPKRRSHPDLVPWERLTEEAQQKDFEAVSSWPDILEEAGFRLIARGR